ncbi:MAG: hypothetical protein ACPF8V_04450 [Luteibaculum sp.]
MIKKLLLLSGIAFLLSACNPKLESIFNAGAEFDEPFYLELPFTTVNDYIIIEAQINGRKKRFALQTGLPTIINQSLFLDLNENIRGEVMVHDLLGQSERLLVCEVDRIDIAGTPFLNVPVAVIDDETPLLKCLQVDGIIGSNMLRHTILHLDKKHGAVVITNDIYKLSGVNINADIPMEKNGQYSSPMVYLNLNEKAKERVIFDTGAKSFLSTTNEHVTALLEYKVLESVESAYGFPGEFGLFGNRNSKNLYQSKLNRVDLGLMSFFNVVTQSLGDTKIARLGLPLLDFGTVTIDYERSKFYVQGYEKKFKVDLNQMRYPLSPALVDGNWLVGVVWQESFLPLKDQRILAVGEEEIPAEICPSLIHGIPYFNRSPLEIATRDFNGNIRKSKLLAY